MATLTKYGNYLISLLPKHIQRVSIFKDELCLHIPSASIPQTLELLRDHKDCMYKQLMEVTAVDWPTDPDRFELVYSMLSVEHNSRILVKSRTSELAPVPSVSHLFSSAIWAEREVWDMFGVIFNGHPDLRRILTDYGFEGHPLRKDFPLTGFTEVRYDEEKKRIVSEPVELTQEFRKFDFPNPVRHDDICAVLILIVGAGADAQETDHRASCSCGAPALRTGSSQIIEIHQCWTSIIVMLNGYSGEVSAGGRSGQGEDVQHRVCKGHLSHIVHGKVLGVGISAAYAHAVDQDQAGSVPLGRYHCAG